jgi:formate C-acetyltransferase
LGRTPEDQVTNFVATMDAFFGARGYHMNINVLNRATLLDAMDHSLTREQQMGVINRTFHGAPA